MKVTMEFDLPEDQGELDLVLKAGNMYAALYQFRNYLRNWQKHGENWQPVCGDIWDEFHKIVSENDVPEI
jgi:hypothetical protein